MHRQWLARNAEHTRRRELLLLPKVHVPLPRIPSLPSPASPPTHARTLLYGIPGLRTPTQKSRWECALRVEMLAAKVHAPPPAAESKGVYR